MHGPFHGGGTLTERAAYLLRGIAQDHPFVDGNKRTAFDGAAMFLEQNGQAINADADAVVSFMLDVAQGHHTVPSIQAWIDRHAKPLLGEETEEGA